MACHELAALRLGLMKVLGIKDEAEKQHELAELGKAANSAGPIKSLSEAPDLASLKKFYEASLSQLEEKIAHTKTTDPKLPYYRSLLILTKKVEMDLRQQIDNLTRMYKDLDEIHDFVHEIYPAE